MKMYRESQQGALAQPLNPLTPWAQCSAEAYQCHVPPQHATSTFQVCWGLQDVKIRAWHSRRSAVDAFQRQVPPSAPFLLVNGLIYDSREFNLYDFVDLVRKEVGGRFEGWQKGEVRRSMLVWGGTEEATGGRCLRAGEATGGRC
jgi:hypothetical protein